MTQHFGLCDVAEDIRQRLAANPWAVERELGLSRRS
jgi:hypothetical protein